MEGSTNTAEAVERITNTLAYARSVGNNDRNSYPFRVGDVDRLLSRITELEKALGPFAAAFDPQRAGSGLYRLAADDLRAAASRLLTEGAK